MKKRHLLLILPFFLSWNILVQQENETDPPDENRFKKVVLSTALADPSDMAILPNGDVLITELDGDFQLFKAASKKTRTVNHINIDNAPETGLLAIVLDPAFAKNHWVYVMYSPLMQRFNYISRFTWTGDSLRMASEKVLLKIPDERACCHVGGGLAFDTKGNLYITVGDNTNPFGTNYAPIDDRPDRKNYNAQRTAANSKDLRGKVLRIKPEPDGTYSIPEGNLFSDSAVGRPEIFAMGCRNPYKITIDKQSDVVYWGEVGPDASDATPKGPRGYDELNRAAHAGNFGWPYIIADNEAYAAVDFVTDSIGAFYDPAQPVNNSVFNTGLKQLSPVQKPLLWYPYDKSDRFPELGSGGRTLIAGPFFYADDQPESSVSFPAYFNGALFIADWMRNWIKVVRVNREGTLERIEHFMPATLFQKPIALKFGPDNALYVLEFGSLWGGNTDSKLVRVEYTKGNRPPVANLTADKRTGPLPLKVQFSARSSFDYDAGDSLSYQWTYRGKTVTSNNPVQEMVFPRPGTHKVLLTVRDKEGKWDTAAFVVKAGNAAPDVALVLKDKKMFYGAGIPYEVKVTDREDGSLQKGTIPPQKIQVSMQYFPDGKIAAGGNEKMLNPYQKGSTWINESDCKACHAVKAKSVGPSFVSIANRYAKSRQNPTTINRRGTKIIAGGRGVWGEANMSAHPQLNKETAAEMVRYILSLSAKNNTALRLPVKGTVKVNRERKGTYVLKAAYTDKGGTGIGPLTGSALAVLRSPVITAPDFDAVYELKQSEILTSVNKDAYAQLKDVDLTGISKIRFHVSTETEGTGIEVRLDAPTGPLLGSADVPIGKWNVWQQIQITIPPVTGMHHLYVVFKNRLYVLNLLNLKSMELD
jgi:cytochrome c